jgi:enamine deaminase RidA (YjgF/YER057c/UK114 family)
MVTIGSRPASAEQRLKELGIKLPVPPEPFGTYVEAVQAGNLLFLGGMLPTEGREAKFIGRVGAELDVDAAREAAKLAALNVLGVARQHLGSLDRLTRIVRLGVSVATSGDVRDRPKVADAASELLQDVFGKDKSPCRLVYGVASLPLGVPVELEVIFEVGGREKRSATPGVDEAAPCNTVKTSVKIKPTGYAAGTSVLDATSCTQRPQDIGGRRLKRLR